eukprot:COSAG06_NODE_95_length_24425_cov_882.571035_6_plen_118_part_00
MAVAGRPLAVMSEMKVSQEDVCTRGCAWRGAGAGMASRFMANRALSPGARTNGAVCAAPGGSRHHLYHRLSFLRREEARDEARAGGEQAAWDLDPARSFRVRPVPFEVYSTPCEPPP